MGSNRTVIRTSLKSELGRRLKHFKDAVKKLEEYRKTDPSFPITAGIIRKCRIAMDLGFKCPYTGKEYCVRDLPYLDREHVVPYSGRNSNSMASLVLTWPEVNKLKGNRTGLQFVQEEQGREIVCAGGNVSITTPKRYEDFVKKLGTKGSPDDQRRKKRRKELMMVEVLSIKSTHKENLGFTDGMMTQSSYLMKIAGHVARRICPNSGIINIPGAVTASVRASWKAWGMLAQANINVTDDAGRLMDKESIRGVTHLHHAVDACVLGLIPLLIPAGKNGIVWQALCLRSLSAQQREQLRNLNLRGLVLDDAGHLLLRSLPDKVRESFVAALKEQRVITHLPADMSGARLEETTWGIKEVENGIATLQQRKRTVQADGTRQTVKKTDRLCCFPLSEHSVNTSRFTCPWS